MVRGQVMLHNSHSKIYMPFSLKFRGLKKMRYRPQTNQRTDRWMDRRTNGRTDPHIEMRGRI